MREEEPTKTKSWAVLLWHCNVWQRETKKTVSNSDSNRKKWEWQEESPRTLRRSRHTILNTNTLEKEKVALWVSYQVWFGCIPTCVGLPETQTSISIHDTELHKTFREQISDFAEIKLELSFILHQADENTLSGAPPVFAHPLRTFTPFRWFGLCSNYLPKHVNSLTSPSTTYITKIKRSACPLFPIFFFFLKSIFHSFGQNRQIR